MSRLLQVSTVSAAVASMVLMIATAVVVIACAPVPQDDATSNATPSNATPNEKRCNAAWDAARTSADTIAILTNSKPCGPRKN